MNRHNIQKWWQAFSIAASDQKPAAMNRPLATSPHRGYNPGMGTDSELFQARRRLDAQDKRIDELGRIVETHADRIGWLVAEITATRGECRTEFQAFRDLHSRLFHRFGTLEADIQKERHYRQTGRLPEKKPAAKVVSTLVGDVLTEGEGRRHGMRVDVSREAAIGEVLEESADIARNRTVYPVTIIATRYGGTYEGGRYAAFNMDEDDIPGEATAGDHECETWWRDVAPGLPVGVGATPDAALVALSDRLAEKSPVVPQDGRTCADGLTPCRGADRALQGIVGELDAEQERGANG